MVRSAVSRTPSQISLRGRLDGLEFETALPIAVKALFHFTHRARDSKALWAKSQCVWLGRSTFLHWSLNDDFDVPWLVAKTKNAPRDKESLQKLVQDELAAYFADRLSKLPRRSTGNWLPLP